MNKTVASHGDFYTGKTVEETIQIELDLTEDERNWAMGSHLAAFAGYVGIPFGNIIGPFLIWHFKKDESSFVADHAKDSLNFQLSMTIYALICAFLTIFIIGFLLLPIVLLAGVIYPIVAAVKAREGELYEYPFTMQIIQ